MSAVDFAKVKKVPQRVRDLISGFVRANNLNSTYQTPESIHLIIILFYWISLKSKILTDDESQTLLDMIEKDEQFKHFGAAHSISYELIFQSYKPEQRENSFKSICHNKKNLLCIIHTKRNNVFGGFTASGWFDGNNDGLDYSKVIEDDKAFLFSIRSSLSCPPAIYSVKKPEKALQMTIGFYCCFGSDYLMYVYDMHSNDKVAVYSEGSYERFDNRVFRGDGGDSDIVQGLEVYQLQML